MASTALVKYKARESVPERRTRTIIERLQPSPRSKGGKRRLPRVSGEAVAVAGGIAAAVGGITAVKAGVDPKTVAATLTIAGLAGLMFGKGELEKLALGAAIVGASNWASSAFATKMTTASATAAATTTALDQARAQAAGQGSTVPAVNRT